MPNFWKSIFAILLLLLVSALFFLGVQIGRVADSGEKISLEVRETKSLAQEFMTSPEKNRQFARNVEDWFRRVHR